MLATIEMNEAVAKLLGVTSPDELSASALRALVAEACRKGRISRGKAAEILGLSFHEAELFFRAQQMPYPLKSSGDDERENV